MRLAQRVRSDASFREKYASLILEAALRGAPLTREERAAVRYDGDVLSSDLAERAIGVTASDVSLGDSLAFDAGWRTALALGVLIGSDPTGDHTAAVARLLVDARAGVRATHAAVIGDLHLAARSDAGPSLSIVGDQGPVIVASRCPNTPDDLLALFADDEVLE